MLARLLVPCLALLLGCSGGRAASTSQGTGGGSHAQAGAGGTGTSSTGTSGTGTSGAGGTGTGGAGGAGRIWGVTVDDVSNLAGIVAALQKLPVRPTARIVFDKGLGPADYSDAVKQIHAVAGVMGEIVDSSDVAALSLVQYEQRAQDYLTQLGGDVDIWEIGNEINGDPWLGPTADVVPKMTGAYDAAKKLGRTTALTLYYNQGCFAQPDHEMFAWALANVPDSMKQGLDYVLVSFYEDDCNGIMPDWPSVFAQLAAMFPHSKIGFGECGTKLADRKAAYVDRYYRMKIDHPRWVGGDFWWYFAEDMVPASQPLWTTLDLAILGK